MEDHEVLENVNQIRANARKVLAYHFLQLLQFYVVADHLAGQLHVNAGGWRGYYGSMRPVWLESAP